MESLIAELELAPHPEGGFYKRFYTSASATLDACGSPRPQASSILFLLPGGGSSSLHRLGSEELWYYQAGEALTVVQLAQDGAVTEAQVRPGRPVVVPAGALFGAYLPPGKGFALVACAVVPAFKWEEFELPPREQLRREFEGKGEAARVIIERLGHSGE